MIVLALAPPSIAVVSFDLRCPTLIPKVETGRPGSSLHPSRSKQAFNAPRRHTPSFEIPIASDARPRQTSRGFLPWRFADAGSGVRRATSIGPASANLHRSGRPSAVPKLRRRLWHGEQGMPSARRNCTKARMVCPSCQSVAIGVVDLGPKSKPKSAHPVSIRGTLRGRHERWVRDAVDVGSASDESACLRTAKSYGPDASTLASSLRSDLQATVTNKPDHRGDYEGNR